MPTPDLIRQWRKARFITPPFLFPGDQEVIKATKTKTCAHRSHDEWIASAEFGKRQDISLHLGLIPSPYWGDLRRASVFILMLNPGLGTADYFAETISREFRESAIQVLRQDFDGNFNPSCFLDPRFSWHGGFDYWASKLDQMIHTVVQQRNASYQEVLRFVGERIACLQLVPYHSRNFGVSSRCLLNLPSSLAIREFVRAELVPATRRGEKTLIVTRGSKHWGLTEGRGIVVYNQSECRGAHLNLKSRGGKAIAKALGLSVCF